MSSFHGNKLKANHENNDIHHILRSGGSQHVLWVNHAFKQMRRNAIHKSSHGRTDAHNNAIIKSRCAVNQRALYPKWTVNEVQWFIFPTESLDTPFLLLHDYILCERSKSGRCINSTFWYWYQNACDLTSFEVLIIRNTNSKLPLWLYSAAILTLVTVNVRLLESYKKCKCHNLPITGITRRDSLQPRSVLVTGAL